MMLATDYMMKGDTEGALESLNNIMIATKDAKPAFNSFARYRKTQKLWEVMCELVAKNRYDLRKVMEEHNITNHPIVRNEQSVRQLGKEEIVAALHKVFDFELGDDDRKALADRFYVKTFFDDEMLFRSGDFNETMYIILKGELMLFAGTHQTGGEIEIARLSKGDILGESCLKNQPFTLNCRATQFTELIGIDRRDIYKMIENRPELGVKFYQQVLVKVVGKMRTNNLYNMSMGGGTVEEAVHDATIVPD